MATIDVILNKHQQKRNGDFPIYIRVTKDRQTNYASLGCSCPIDLWDAKRRLPKTKHPLYAELKVLIEEWKLRYEKGWLELANSEADYTSKQIIALVRKSVRQIPSVLSYFDQIVKSLEEKEDFGTADTFRYTKNRIAEFSENKDVEFKNITSGFLRGFIQFCISRKNKLTTQSVYLRTFQRLYNYAKADGYIKAATDPFKEFGMAKFRKPATQKRAIAREELAMIEQFATIPGSRMFHSKQYFIFSYYALGINFTDIARLKWSNVRGNQLDYTRTKTQKPQSVGLLPPALEILEYYQQNYPAGHDGYIFPILNPDYPSPKSIRDRIKKILRQTNADLKTISAELGIVETNMTTYVARHTAATVLRRSGQSTAIIQELLGHDSERTTQTYLKGFGSDELLEASKGLIANNIMKTSN